MGRVLGALRGERGGLRDPHRGRGPASPDLAPWPGPGPGLAPLGALDPLRERAGERPPPVQALRGPPGRWPSAGPRDPARLAGGLRSWRQDRSLHPDPRRFPLLEALSRRADDADLGLRRREPRGRGGAPRPGQRHLPLLAGGHPLLRFGPRSGHERLSLDAWGQGRRAADALSRVRRPQHEQRRRRGRVRAGRRPPPPRRRGEGQAPLDPRPPRRVGRAPALALGSRATSATPRWPPTASGSRSRPAARS